MGFVPVEMRINYLAIGTHYLTDLIGDVPHLLCIGAYDAELHGETDRRPEIEPVHTHPRFGERAIRNRFLNSCLDSFARLDIF